MAYIDGQAVLLFAGFLGLYFAIAYGIYRVIHG